MSTQTTTQTAPKTPEQHVRRLKRAQPDSRVTITTLSGRSIEGRLDAKVNGSDDHVKVKQGAGWTIVHFTEVKRVRFRGVQKTKHQHSEQLARRVMARYP